jgi:hypothetical protein
MEVLDLHGIRHADVEAIVEDFVCAEEPPFEIITGNSFEMHSIVNGVLSRYGLEIFRNNPNNMGSMVVIEKL